MNSWPDEPMTPPQAPVGGRAPATDVLPRPDASNNAPAGLRSTSVGSVAGLRGMRRSIATWLDELGIDDSLFVTDVQLAAVEIVTNAFVHSSATSVDVSLEIVDGHAVVTVEHSSPIPTPAHTPTALPGDDSVSGRGLFMVDQIARARTVHHTGATSMIKLDIALPVA
jgi:anti-sigma regulatory factor (Ser/Thr protein kinase)